MFITAFADTASGTAQAPGGILGALPSLIMPILLIAVLYFIMIRPQKKKEKELKEMLAALKVGDEVATIGGLHGKIVRIKDDLFVIESGIGTMKSHITVDRSAVSRFLKRGEETQKPTPIPGEEATETTEE